ncbi:phage head closure protein [Clostridium sardiniense]|uniref:phage head closure protein n=1 Tax=Clostridium sardiniense TaxID=29369 RepID=UPI003D354321
MISDYNQKKKQLLTTYNNKIEIVKNDGKEFDDDGYRIDNYVTVFECWANINNLYGKELYSAFGVNLENILNVKVRYCDKLKELFIDNENGNREYKVKWNNKIYDIKLADFLGFNKTEVILKVRLVE